MSHLLKFAATNSAFQHSATSPTLLGTPSDIGATFQVGTREENSTSPKVLTTGTDPGENHPSVSDGNFYVTEGMRLAKEYRGVFIALKEAIHARDDAKRFFKEQLSKSPHNRDAKKLQNALQIYQDKEIEIGQYKKERLRLGGEMDALEEMRRHLPAPPFASYDHPQPSPSTFGTHPDLKRIALEDNTTVNATKTGKAWERLREGWGEQRLVANEERDGLGRRLC